MPPVRRHLQLSLWSAQARGVRLREAWPWALALLLCGSLARTALGDVFALWLTAAAAAFLLVHSLVRGLRRARVGSLRLDADGLRRLERGRAAQALWESNEPLGLALLGDRERCALVLTSPGRMRTLALQGSSPSQLERLRARLPLSSPDAWTPRADCAVSGRDAERLVDELLRREPASAQCMYLRDALGASIALREGTLQFEERTLDLQRPFELEAFRFYESLGQVVGGYQALWLSQRPSSEDAPLATECVLVATLSAEAAHAPALLDPRTSAQLLRAPRHSVDALLMPSLWQALRSHAQPRTARSHGRLPSSGDLRNAN